MRKIIVFILTFAMVFSLASVQMFAADPISGGRVTAAGFYNIGLTSGMSVTPTTSAGGTITSVSAEVDSAKTGYETFYPDSEKLSISLSGANVGSQYLVLLVTGSELPDKSSQICYIDQVEATSGTVNFTVYPMLPESTTSMTAFITSNADGYTTKSVSLNYAKSGTYEKAPYTLGDVNSDGSVTSYDALLVLQHEAEIVTLNETQQLAANTSKIKNSDNDITSYDALLILQYEAEIISSWE